MVSVPLMRRLSCLFLVAFLFIASESAAQGLAIAARAGTLGPGFEAIVPIGSKFNIRAGGSYFSFTRSQVLEDEDTDVEFKSDVQWGAFGGMVDWHPFSSGFRLTGGAFVDLRDVSATGTPLTAVTIEDKEFSPERLGSLTAGFRYDQTISPYLGIGFGDAARGARVGFLFDLGMVYAGSPTFHMEGTGMIAPTANWAPTLTEGLQSFKWMPLISIGLGVRIF